MEIESMGSALSNSKKIHALDTNVPIGCEASEA